MLPATARPAGANQRGVLLSPPGSPFARRPPAAQKNGAAERHQPSLFRRAKEIAPHVPSGRSSTFPQRLTGGDLGRASIFLERHDLKPPTPAS